MSCGEIMLHKFDISHYIACYLGSSYLIIIINIDSKIKLIIKDSKNKYDYQRNTIIKRKYRNKRKH